MHRIACTWIAGQAQKKRNRCVLRTPPTGFAPLMHADRILTETLEAVEEDDGGAKFSNSSGGQCRSIGRLVPGLKVGLDFCGRAALAAQRR